MKIDINDNDAEWVCRLLQAVNIDYDEVESGEDRFYSRLWRSQCMEAATLLETAFPWSNSPEGGEYWKEVHEKLFRYGSE